MERCTTQQLNTREIFAYEPDELKWSRLTPSHRPVEWRRHLERDIQVKAAVTQRWTKSRRSMTLLSLVILID